MAELPLLTDIGLASSGTRSPFAVVEASTGGPRVLYFVQDQGEAIDLAAELRQRGVHAGAYRSHVPGDAH